MKTNKFVNVVYDRKGKALEKGISKVEIYIYLGNGQKKYLTIHDCTPLEWTKYKNSPEVKKIVKDYETIIQGMLKRGEPMTIEQLDQRLGLTPRDTKEDRERKALFTNPNGFILFIQERMKHEKLHPNTIRRYLVVIDSLIRFGKLCRFTDLTDINLKEYDDFLRKEDPTRTDVALNNYHKIIKKYARLAFLMHLIPNNPYESPLCKFKRGKCKERRPLTAEELRTVINLNGLTKGEEHARDLFIFSAFTGLAYADNQNFDFETMTMKSGKLYFIVGERLKNGHNFFTPILPPAMDILKKYDFVLPKMSNQKMNQFLHLVETRAKLHKPMTSHVARHSFATIALNLDTPTEGVAKMLGHTSISTTKIYAQLMTKTVERYAAIMAAEISAMFNNSNPLPQT